MRFPLLSQFTRISGHKFGESPRSDIPPGLNLNHVYVFSINPNFKTFDIQTRVGKRALRGSFVLSSFKARTATSLHRSFLIKYALCLLRMGHKF